MKCIQPDRGTGEDNYMCQRRHGKASINSSCLQPIPRRGASVVSNNNRSVMSYQHGPTGPQYSHYTATTRPLHGHNTATTRPQHG
ncbi:hypothetical protein ACOMHN_027188 [Nucella lapillus]